MNDSFIDILFLPELFRIFRSVEDLFTLYADGNLSQLFIKLFSDSGFGDSIRGQSVLIKPNLVMNPTTADYEKCLITHPNFILQTVEAILAFGPSKVVIGDAPIQLCAWDALFSRTFNERLDLLARRHNTEITVRDFRRTIWSSVFKVTKEIRPLSDYVLYDLKDNSYLEPITGDAHNFRVNNYDPGKLHQTHKKGKHVYCIAKEIFETDVIVQLPKIKTHQKSGITNALKNLVGINGDKDFLPHHRAGGFEKGGDCYPGSNPLRRVSEKLLDQANKHIGSAVYYPLNYGSKFLWKLLPGSPFHSLSAGWYGNDTTWRMVADINKIAYYGNVNGELSEKPVRKIFSLCDGIIAGQGNGPLNPAPLPLGVVIFTDNPLLADLAVAKMMRFKSARMPLLHELKRDFNVSDFELTVNYKSGTMESLKQISLETQPPPGWRGHIEEPD